MKMASEKRTPMAWQHRDLNYHQHDYHERYGPGVDMPPSRPGPPSMSDRLSHRTDKSWRTKESQPHSSSAYPGQMTPGSYMGPGPYPGRAFSGQQIPGSVTESTSSSSDQDTDEDIQRTHKGPPSMQQVPYGYSGVPYGYPGAAPNIIGHGYPPGNPEYPGTIKSAKSVPSMAMQSTWDGEPCPVHGVGPMSLPMDHPSLHHPMASIPPSLMPISPPASMPPVPMAPRRAASIYDLRMAANPTPTIYGTLPGRMMIPGDRKSLAGMPAQIPHQLLPPMVRPRPMVLSEDGTAEPLPVRAPHDKSLTLNGLPSKLSENDPIKKKICSHGGSCVAWIILGVIATGIVIGLLIVFIL